ncbi:MAG: hypothetical protein ACRDBL_11395 [Rhabdaerophilum sp.]
MIELPDWPGPNGAEAALLDFGINLRAALGGATVRVNRPGARYRVALSYPLMTAAEARPFVSRLIRAKSAGLRVPFPLLESQGNPGAPVVDGAGQAGTTLNLRGATVGHVFKEGSWLSVVGGGRHYLQNVAASTMVGADGRAALPIAPMLRFPFPDGAAIHAAEPMIDGFVDGDTTDWTLRVDHLVQLGFAIEEYA